MAWPTDKSPCVEGYRRGPGSDPTIRDRGRGRPLSRPGCEAILDDIWFTLRKLTTTQRSTYDSFQKTTAYIGGGPFNFTDPIIGDTVSVTLAEPMIFELDREPSTWWTNVHFHVEPAY